MCRSSRTDGSPAGVAGAGLRLSTAAVQAPGVDPLTAVVLLSLASAGGAVAILQMNEDASGSIEVPLDVFVTGSFPAVCAKTGSTAETTMAVAERRLLRTIARGSIPLTRAQRAQAENWFRLRRAAGLAIVPLIVVVAGFQAIAGSRVVDWATTAAVLAVMYLAGFAHAAGRRSIPGIRSGRDLDAPPVVELRRVHPAFVDAVSSSLQSSA